MNQAIANLARVGGLTLLDALQTATTNPARLIHLPDRNDRVLFREHDPFQIEEVWLDGEKVV
jgi:N-acetylglucosamine-6-phosphate deacetylase